LRLLHIGLHHLGLFHHIAHATFHHRMLLSLMWLM
jgi:hypothetical protein